MGLLKYSVIRKVYFLPLFLLSVMKGLLILLAALVFRGPSWVFRHKKRDVRPDCLNEPQLGTHKFITVKDVKLHVVESGDPKKPLMLFLHGFPECWYSWRHQITEFNKEYHCAAFDMRGAGESEGPSGTENYTLDKLTGDISGLIHALNHETCILVGHDWGGLIGWEFAARYPDMVDKHITMNIPHPNRFAELLSTHLSQMLMSWYIFFIQMPWGLPEIMFRMGDYAMLEEGWKAAGLTEDDVEALKFSFSRPGRLETFLHYYHNELEMIFNETGRVTAPTLLIWGTGDLYLHTQLSHDTEKFCSDLTVERIEGCGHFVQQERSDLVNGLMRKYLEKES